MKYILFDKRIINVSILFIAAYSIIHLLYLFIVFVCADYIDAQEIKVYFSYVSYDISTFTDWTRMKIVILYGLPSFLMLTLAGVFYVAMESFSFAKSARQKLFCLWLILISLSFTISSLVSAPFSRQSIAIVAEWFYFKRELTFGISLFFWASIPLVAYFSSKSFMKLANSREYILTKWTRLIFLLKNILLPFSIGSVFFSFLIISAPGYTITHYFKYDFMRFVVLLIILLFVFWFNFHKRYIGIKRTKDLEYLSIPMLIFMVIVLTTVYLGLFFT